MIHGPVTANGPGQHVEEFAARWVGHGAMITAHITDDGARLGRMGRDQLPVCTAVGISDDGGVLATEHRMISANAVKGSHFRPDIEGLRAVAVVGVIAFHFGLTQLSGGYAGVDVFFVISGFLITTHLRSQIANTGSINLFTFYAGRLRRLLPSVFLVVIATLAAGYFLYAPAEQATYSSDAFYTSAYILNIKLLKNAFDYFAPEAGLNPFLHFWSLAVEEQFYLFWPLLLLLHSKVVKLLSLKILLALVVAISFVGCCLATYASQPWAFYALPFRAWEFAVGGSIPLWPQLLSFRSRKALGYIGLLLIATSYFMLSEDSVFPGWGAVLPVAGASLVIYAGIDPRSRVDVLHPAPFQFVGSISYPLYLWHWPVIVYGSALPFGLSVLDRLALVAGTFLLAIASKRLVEDPVRFSRRLVEKPALSFMLAAILTLGGMGSALVAKHIAVGKTSDRQRQILAETSKLSAARTIGPNCLAGLLDENPTPCTLGDATSNRTIVLFGDSHADAWSTPLDLAAKAEGIRLITLMKSSCPFADIQPFSMRLHRRFLECEHWKERAFQQILEIKPDLVIMAQFTPSYVKNSSFEEGSNSAEEFLNGVRRTAATLSKSGATVVVLKDVPFMRKSIPNCLSRSDWIGWSTTFCDVPREVALDPEFERVEAETLARSTSPYLIDLTDAFCDSAICRSVHDGMPMFRDGHHLSDSYSSTLAQRLKPMLASMLSFPPGQQ